MSKEKERGSLTARLRRVNTILALLLIAIFMLHGVLGSFTLLEISPGAGKTLAWVGVGLMAVHALIGIVLTIQTLRASKMRGERYLKQNALFWTRRFSGLAIALLAFFHVGAFGAVKAGRYILLPFTTAKLIAQLALVAALFVHIFVNIRPMLVSLGALKYRQRRWDLFLILSILLLLISGALILYYIGWQFL